MGNRPLAAPKQNDAIAVDQGMPMKSVATRIAETAPIAAARGADCRKAVSESRRRTTGTAATSAEGSQCHPWGS